ncbi:hypothetical protein ACIPLC_25420 [Kitasatospora sp. NPDC086801]
MGLAPSCDQVVIGAGTAGSLLSARLNRSPDRSVPILEPAVDEGAGVSR